MKIGIIVDGQAEYHSLPLLLEKVNLGAQIQIVRPVYCDMQPHASPAQIAYAATKKISILRSKGVSHVIVLLDKETRPDCTVELVGAIEQTIMSNLAGTDETFTVRVVLKITTYENWLVADPNALKQLRGIFQYPERIRREVEPNKADNVDALLLLKTCAVDKSFDKVRCGKAICNQMDLVVAAQNSRSFRRFLRVLGHGLYCAQSKRPASSE